MAGGPASSSSPDGPPLQTAILPSVIAADTHGNVAFTESLPYPAGTTDAVREVTAQSTLTTLGGRHSQARARRYPRPRCVADQSHRHRFQSRRRSLYRRGGHLPHPQDRRQRPGRHRRRNRQVRQFPACRSQYDAGSRAARRHCGRQPGTPLHARSLRQFLPHCGRWQSVPDRVSAYARPWQDRLRFEGPAVSHEHVQPHSHLAGRQAGDDRRFSLAARRPAPGLRAYFARRHRHGSRGQCLLHRYLPRRAHRLRLPCQ